MKDSPTEGMKSMLFHAFCRDVFTASGTSTVQEWAELIGCREPDLVQWATGSGLPDDDDLLRIDTALRRHGRSTVARARWEDILQRPLREVTPIRVPGNVSLGKRLRRAMERRLQVRLAELPERHRRDLLYRFGEHAETLGHYIVKG